MERTANKGQVPRQEDEIPLPSLQSDEERYSFPKQGRPVRLELGRPFTRLTHVTDVPKRTLRRC